MSLFQVSFVTTIGAITSERPRIEKLLNKTMRHRGVSASRQKHTHTRALDVSAISDDTIRHKIRADEQRIRRCDHLPPKALSWLYIACVRCAKMDAARAQILKPAMLEGNLPRPLDELRAIRGRMSHATTGEKNALAATAHYRAITPARRL